MKITRNQLRKLIMNEGDGLEDYQTCDPGGCEIEIGPKKPEELEAMRKELAGIIDLEIKAGTKEKEAKEMVGWDDKHPDFKGKNWRDYLPSNQKNEGVKMKVTRRQLRRMINEEIRRISEGDEPVQPSPETTREIRAQSKKAIAKLRNLLYKKVEKGIVDAAISSWVRREGEVAMGKVAYWMIHHAEITMDVNFESYPEGEQKGIMSAFDKTMTQRLGKKLKGTGHYQEEDKQASER